MEVDYARYADGEALLGWLNAEYLIQTEHEFDANDLLARLADSFVLPPHEEVIDVAHLKMCLREDASPAGVIDDPARRISAIQWVRNDAPYEFTQKLDLPVRRGRLTINLRAQNDPEMLRARLEAVIKHLESEFSLACVQTSAFKPSPPRPTHRITTL